MASQEELVSFPADTGEDGFDASGGESHYFDMTGSLETTDEGFQILVWIL